MYHGDDGILFPDPCDSQKQGIQQIDKGQIWTAQHCTRKEKARNHELDFLVSACAEKEDSSVCQINNSKRIIIERHHAVWRKAHQK